MKINCVRVETVYSFVVYGQRFTDNVVDFIKGMFPREHIERFVSYEGDGLYVTTHDGSNQYDIEMRLKQALEMFVQVENRG